jgi:hypothetical protein
MNRESRAFLEAVVVSIADGHDCDWSLAERECSAGADSAGVLRQLRVIATIAHVHRTIGADRRLMTPARGERRSTPAKISELPSHKAKRSLRRGDSSVNRHVAGAR